MNLTLDHFVGAIATGLIALLVGVLKHILDDARYRQKVDDLAKRVSKLDGINGKHAE